MKNVKFFALILMSFISVQSFAQQLKTADLKNATIKSFLLALDGTDETAEKVIVKYGTTDVKENGLIASGKVSRIVSETGNCVQFETIWVLDPDDKVNGTEVLLYDICEKGGKIISFDLNFGDEDDSDDEE